MGRLRGPRNSSGGPVDLIWLPRGLPETVVKMDQPQFAHSGFCEIGPQVHHYRCKFLSPEELAAWLKQILRREVIDA